MSKFCETCKRDRPECQTCLKNKKCAGCGELIDPLNYIQYVNMFKNTFEYFHNADCLEKRKKPIVRTGIAIQEARKRFEVIAERGIRWNYAEESNKDIDGKIDIDNWMEYYNGNCEAVFKKQNPEWRVVIIHAETGEISFTDIDIDEPEFYYTDVVPIHEYISAYRKYQIIEYVSKSWPIVNRILYRGILNEIFHSNEEINADIHEIETKINQLKGK